MILFHMSCFVVYIEKATMTDHKAHEKKIYILDQPVLVDLFFPFSFLSSFSSHGSSLKVTHACNLCEERGEVDTN